MIHKSKKAFTLIEMLIVIVIIGILAAALVPRLQSVQGRARDTKRKADIRQIYTANQIYHTDIGKYPPAGACTYNNPGCHVFSASGAMWNPTISGYITALPLDPVNTFQASGAWTTGAYVYSYGNVYDVVIPAIGMVSYDMTTLLENSSDPDRCGFKRYTNIQNSTCQITGSYQMNYYFVSPHNIK